MNFGRKNIQHSAKYKANNFSYKKFDIALGIEPDIAPGIMPEISKGTALGIALGLELGIVFMALLDLD